ncbi:tRNA (adenosine(37)-N6)-threonylcarbamoyltransferase complex ATPase subunit type 1 TsaE [Kordiimonas marina]|uniref:tRNA (adenosine(37)-N6)-threonylcarbamoyltransferase complex ATPase subunit type 1 TsaE n=1 Tax=Kordiimonas marina TaxID=2872312 RepID=UPI001FF16B41|nr:tRNA (adenosine(37)-N6)-threonylcarbamoyltransferase complex ATPase subunit type 1 TsaE [Kordiimonas marina]MCJ9428313.1 tRNA (adenosine(37)-N6)-threonylcarbamoyltransferase complex ATPase subunit type 1 TsaE [Kordiimonas marina]
MAATVRMQIDCADEQATAALAARLAARLQAGDLVALTGDLGAGKSTFARAFIRARLADDMAEVPSPTFTLVQTYDDPEGGEIWHADLYRLTEPEEAYELGLDEAREDAICLIEWPDRMPADWWQGALSLDFTIGEKGVRHVVVSGDNAAWVPRLEGLAP